MQEPRIAVVVATHDRADRLALLLDALRAQTIPHGEFEVVIVDDGSADSTPAVLADAERADDLDLRVLRREPAGGPAVARNLGWRVAHAPLVAFTDDDCRPSPHWLEELLIAAEESPGALVQGRVDKDPEQMDDLSAFAHWYEVRHAGEGFPTCNILYPRALLERMDGFDESFAIAGEDTDLGWRAVESGAGVVFAPDALVHHGIIPVGPIGRLRLTQRWAMTIRNYRRHPEMPKVKGLFWRHNHYELFRFLVALALPRRFGALRLFLAAPYVVHLTDRRTGPLLAPYLLAVDMAEVMAVVRGAIRYRVLVL